MTEAPLLHAPQPPGSRHFAPILRPDLATLYARRAARLRALAAGHELSEYLVLAAQVTDAQAACLGAPAADLPPDPAGIAAAGLWPALLDRMLADLRPKVAAPVREALAQLQALPEAARRTAAIALAEGRFDAVDPALTPFLWAALSAEVARAARAAPLPGPTAQEPPDCPLCGTAPVASTILTGDDQGLRYLHCALCDCDWHMVRAKCTNCGDAGQLDYLSFETPEAPIRAEACGACASYLKVISQERDREADTVADDLASLVLDDAASAEGFGRSGFNPFALPSG